MRRRLDTVDAPGGEFPLNGFELPGGREKFLDSLSRTREVFPAGVDLIVGALCFQKVSSLRGKSVAVVEELLGLITDFEDLPKTVRVVAFLDAAREGFSGLVSGIYRSTVQERNTLNALLGVRFTGPLPPPCRIKSPTRIAVRYFMHGNEFVRPYWVLLHE